MEQKRFSVKMQNLIYGANVPQVSDFDGTSAKKAAQNMKMTRLRSQIRPYSGASLCAQSVGYT